MAAQQLTLRVRFTKTGRMKYLSHAEFSRLLTMAARRSELPLLYAGKFRPRVKLSLSPPLPIGVTSECEIIDFFLGSYVSPAEAEHRLSGSLPRGVEVTRCRLMGEGARAVGKIIDTAVFRATLPPGSGPEGDWSRAVEVFLGRDSISVERVQPRRTRTVDLRPGVHGIEVAPGEGGALEVTMTVDDGIKGTVKPFEVLGVLAELAGAPSDTSTKATMHRLGLFARRGEKLVSPMELSQARRGRGGPRGGARY